MSALHWWTSSSGRIEFQLPLACVEDCSHSGSCDADVFNWTTQMQERLVFPNSVAINELMEIGAWTRSELEALTRFELLEKVIWIAANDISEELFTQ